MTEIDIPRPASLLSSTAVATYGKAVRTQRRFTVDSLNHEPFWRGPARVEDQSTSNHLYRIAQEAAHNAIKHAKPTRVKITLAAKLNNVILPIHDNGMAISKDRNHSGVGSDVMPYGAGKIGGVLEIALAASGGTLVTRSFPR